MKKLSVETLEAFVKANGKNHKPITEIDEKIGANSHTPYFKDCR